MVVGEAHPSGSVRGAEIPVLLEEVVDDGLLMPINPARRPAGAERRAGDAASPWPEASRRGRLGSSARDCPRVFIPATACRSAGRAVKTATLLLARWWVLRRGSRVKDLH